MKHLFKWLTPTLPFSRHEAFTCQAGMNFSSLRGQVVETKLTDLQICHLFDYATWPIGSQWNACMKHYNNWPFFLMSTWYLSNICTFMAFVFMCLTKIVGICIVCFMLQCVLYHSFYINILMQIVKSTYT